MNLDRIIGKAHTIAETYAPKYATELKNILRSMNRTGLKIVVMGDFKVGKSTLINRVFLKKDLLPVEYKEATAVPTRISAGPLRLQAYQAGDTQATVDRENIDADTLARYITAADDTARASLAEQFSHIDLSMPDILPTGITLVDTPGLNTTNTKVMESTQKEARSADGIIYVCRGSILSTRQLQEIRSLCGNQLQQFPLHIVLTAEPTQADWKIEEIQREIESQLQLNGISAHCSAFHFASPTQRGLFTDSSTSMAASTPACGLRRRFGASAAEPAHEPAASNNEQGSNINAHLKSTIETFIQQEVAPKKQSRLARELKPILEGLQFTLESRLSAADKSGEELESMKKNLLRKKLEFENVADNLLSDIRKAQITYKDGVCKLIDKTQNSCSQQLEQADKMNNIWDVVQKMQDSVATDISKDMEILTLDFQTDIRNISAKYEVDLRERLNIVPEDNSINLDMGILAKIPSWLVTILDYVIVVATSPLPWFLDVPLRALAEKISILKKILPASIAANIVRVKVMHIVQKTLTTLKTDISTEMDAKFKDCLTDLKAALIDNSQFKEYEDNINRAMQNQLSATDKQNLQSNLDSIRGWLQDV